MRILIADDDVTSRVLLRTIATRLGHDCLVAEGGSEAWRLLSSQPFDVLLTDWMMPGMNGPELCRRVREDLNVPYVYIVLATGLGHREQVLEGMSAGADDYLIKPVAPFDLETRLIAAERVTALHHQLIDYRSQLEMANSELLGMSLTDSLTGLGNRRRMEQDLQGTYARAQRLGRAFAVVLFDIDHFKLYNDHYGHVGGDDALRRVGRRLGDVVREGESVYRYGGEEFLLLLPDCSVDDAAAAGDRVRQAIECEGMPHEARPTTPPTVTVSGGAACWTPTSALSVVDLLHNADLALYRAKSRGRNQIEVAAVPQPSVSV